MGLLQDKLAKYDLPQQYMAMGVYPYFRTIDSHQDTEVLMDGKKVLMFGSNAYTGLTYDKRIIEAAKAATDKYGTGCAGSRLLNGTLDIHVELEKELAEFVGKDDALCFSTGFTVNEGVIPQLTGRNDYIICDDRVHASIVDGRRLSFSTQLKYKHNDMADLEKELQKCEPDAIKLIVVDSVFSMEGDLANLPEIVRLKKKYNASIMVDEAHGLGVFGKQGRGVCDHFVSVEVRNRNNYPYQNLPLLIYYDSPEALNIKRDTLELRLADNAGIWLGDGWGGLYQSTLPAGFVRIGKAGEYRFKIIHLLPDEVLPGINDVGIKLKR